MEKQSQHKATLALIQTRLHRSLHLEYQLGGRKEIGLWDNRPLYISKEVPLQVRLLFDNSRTQ